MDMTESQSNDDEVSRTVDMIEDPCSRFKGRQLDICRGYDAHGVPVVLPPPHTREAYLRLWGILPDSSTVRAKNPTPNDPTTDKPNDETFGLGDAVKTMLTTIGITPERVAEWTGGPCGCEERRRKLNVLGIAVKRFFLGASWASIRDYLESELSK